MSVYTLMPNGSPINPIVTSIKYNLGVTGTCLVLQYGILLVLNRTLKTLFKYRFYMCTRTLYEYMCFEAVKYLKTL